MKSRNRPDVNSSFNLVPDLSWPWRLGPLFCRHVDGRRRATSPPAQCRREVFCDNSLERGAVGCTRFHAWLAGSVGKTVSDLLVSAVCLRPPGGLRSRGFPGFNSGILRSLSGKGLSGPGETGERPIPLLPAGLAAALSLR